MLSRYLGDKQFWKTAAKLGLPIALQNLLTSSFVLVDTLMVGQLGDMPLSAVGMAGQFSWFMNMILFGICSGASVFIAQYWGARDIKGIHRTYGIALISAALVSTLFTLAAFLMPEGVIKIFNREAGVVESGAIYLSIACWSYIPIALNNVLCITLRSTEKVKLPMYISLFTTVINAAADYGLIFGKFGLPELGIAGAAIATVISAWAGPVLTLIVSAFQKNMLIAPLKDIFGFNRSSVEAYFRKASPVIVNETFWGLGSLLFSVMFANLGYQNYAALTIFRTFENISFVFFIGLCNACCIMIGKAVGAGDIDEAVINAKRFNYVITLLSVIVGGTIILLRHSLASVFNLSGSITPETLAMTALLILIYGFELPLRNLPYIMIVGTFRSGGDTNIGVRLDLVSLWCCSLPLTFVAAFVLKLPFPVVFAIMYIGEDYLKVAMCIKHFVSYRWIKPVTEQGIKGLEEYMARRAEAQAK